MKARPKRDLVENGHDREIEHLAEDTDLAPAIQHVTALPEGSPEDSCVGHRSGTKLACACPEDLPIRDAAEAGGASRIEFR